MNSTEKSVSGSRWNLKILRNLNWNWGGIAIDTGVAFLVCPYLISELGAADYGAWIMIGSMTGYFGLLDLGIKGSVGRFVAFYREVKDYRAVSEVMSTALLLLLIAGLIGFTGVVTATAWLKETVGQEFTAEQLPILRLAILIAGANLALLMPMNAFEGVLWGCQRFDHLNMIRIPTMIIRGIASVAVVTLDGGLVALALVMLLTTLFSGIAKTVVAFRDAAPLRLGPQYIARARVKELVSFGTWNSIRSLATMLPVRVSPFLVGVLVGVAAVAPLSIAGRLVAAVSAMLVAAGGVLTPHATALVAQGDTEQLEKLLLRGSKWGVAAGLYFLTLFVLLGKPLIAAWVGPEMLAAYPLLVILAAGRCFSGTQIVTRGMITAQVRHQPLALASIVQAVVTLGLGTLCMQWWGITGFVVVAAVADALCEGLFSLIFGCRLLELSWRRQLAELGGTAVKMFPPTIALAVLVSWRPANGWIDIVVYGSTFSLLSAFVYLYVIEKLNLLSFVKVRLRHHALSH